MASGQNGRGRKGGACWCSASLHAVEELGGAARRLGHSEPVVGTAVAHLRLDDLVSQPAPAHDEPQRTPEQLRIGELLPGPRLAIVVDHREPCALELLIEAVRRLRDLVTGLPQAEELIVHGVICGGHTIPRSSARCSIAAATVRAGP